MSTLSAKEKKNNLKNKRVQRSKSIENLDMKEKPLKKKEEKHLKKKKGKAEGMPKKPPTAFFIFCAEKRAENTDKKLSAKELGQLFKNLPEDMKALYKRKYEESMKQYEKEIASYIENLHDDNEEKDPKENKKKKAKISKDAAKRGAKKVCNCGRCDECKKNKKKIPDDDEDEIDEDE